LGKRRVTPPVIPPTNGNADHARMDNKSVRRQNIKLLVQKAGGPTEFGKLIDREQVQVSQWVGGKNIGDRLARHIEERLHVAEGTLDHLLPQDVVLADNLLVLSAEENASFSVRESGPPPYLARASQSAGLDADKVEDTITALLEILRRRDPTATLNFEDRIDIELFCEAYAALEELEDDRQGRQAGAVISDLVAIREERRNARRQGEEGQQAGGAAGKQAGRRAAGS
jgi:hypothetical protein